MTHHPLIAEVWNQQRTLMAIVEQDSRTAYFYIWPAELFRTQYAVRGCWVRNLSPAPAQEDREALEQGIAPLLSAEYCRTLEAEPPLDANGLQIIWEPGDEGAALWYYGQLLAVIPGWSLYQQKQISFSAGCIKANRLTSPLGSASTNQHYATAVDHRQFWREWQEGPAWDKFQQAMLSHYQSRFGAEVKYYAIDQGNWPPMAIAQYWHEEVWYFFTLGMSIRPMPQVNHLFDELAPQYRRIEIGMAIDSNIMTEHSAVQMASALAEFAPLPWSRLTWIGDCHTLASEMTPQGFTSFLLAQDLASEDQRIKLPKNAGDPVKLLWATPITANEQHFACQDEYGGHQLLKRLRAEGNSHIFRPRQEVVDASGQ